MKRLSTGPKFPEALLGVLFGCSLGIASPAFAAKAQAIHPIGNPNAPHGGTFSVNLGGEPTTLNPITSTDGYAGDVHEYVIESLLNQNIDTYEYEPRLATAWSISPDGKVFTFTLREGVLWQDGKPFTAEDVKFSFDVIFDPKFPTAQKRPYFEGIDKVEIVDPRTVKFHLKEKYFGNFEVAATMNIVPKHIYGAPEKGPKINKELIGTGPFMIGQYEKGKRLVLKKNQKWWGLKEAGTKGYANFDSVILRFVDQNAVSLEMLKKGDLDFDGFDPETYVEKATGEIWGKKVMKVKTQNSSPKGYGFIGWNILNPLFKDKKVRRALAHLMNRRLMIQKFRYGMGLPATGPWYQQSEYASRKVKPIEYDPKKALALLKEAGWEDTDNDGVLDKVIDGKKTPFRFTLLIPSEDVMKYMTMYKEDMKKVGVDMELKHLEWNSFVKLLDEKKFDAVTLAWGAGSVDLDPKQIWHSSSAIGGGASNFISYKNPEVDRLIMEARGILDKKKRIPMMQKIYEQIADDAPYAFMFNDNDVLYGYSARLGRPKDTFKYAIGTKYWWVEK